MKKTTMLRNLLKEPGLFIIPGVYDCMTARCVEAVGFKAALMSGTNIRRFTFGEPDNGLSTVTEALNLLRYIVKSVNIPVLTDAEDGYGNALHAYRTTVDLIRAGVAGMFMDDQKYPSKSPAYLNGVVSTDEYLGKMAAVLEARNEEDKDFFVVARLDTATTLGDEEMVARAKACVKLGVDAICPMNIPAKSKYFGKRNKETIKQLYKEIGAPEVTIWGGGTPDFTAKDYEEVGAKLWVPAAIQHYLVKPILDYYQEFYDTKSIPKASSPVGSSADRLRKLEKEEFWAGLEKKYMPK